MSYRDEREALQARIARLEVELERARGAARALPAERRTLAERLRGGPTLLAVDRAISGEEYEAALDRVVDALMRRFGPGGQVRQIGRRFSWSLAPGLEVSIMACDGRTEVCARQRLAQLAGGVYGGFVGGLGGAGIGFIAVMGTLAFGRAWWPFALAWLAVVYVFARAVYSVRARAAARSLALAVDDVVAILSEPP